MSERRNVETILDNDAVRLVYYPATKIVHHEFHRFTHGPELRSVLETGLATLQKYGACKWLSDDRAHGAIKPSDGEWGLTDWAPRVVAAGWKYWAIVVPEKIIGQMSMRRFAEAYISRGVTVQLFSEPGPALAWLEEQSSD